MSNTYDPFASGDPTPEAAGNPIRTDRAHAGTSRFTLAVTEVSAPIEGDYGPYVLITGTLKFQENALGGTQDAPTEAPAVGEEVTYLVPFAETGNPKHVQEEIQRAVRRAGGRKGEFVRAGDVLSIKLQELHSKSSKGKVYPKGKEFGKHVAFVAERQADDDPWGSDLPA